MIGRCFQVDGFITGSFTLGANDFRCYVIGSILLVTNRVFILFSGTIYVGASALKILKFGLVFTGFEWTILLTGTIVAFVVSIIAIKFLVGYIKKNDFKAFGYYRIILGIIVIGYFMLFAK